MTMCHVIKNITKINTHKQHQNTAIQFQNCKVAHRRLPIYLMSTLPLWVIRCGIGEVGRPGPTPSLNSIFLENVSEREVQTIIQNFPNKHTCGIHEHLLSLIKACSVELTTNYISNKPGFRWLVFSRPTKNRNIQTYSYKRRWTTQSPWLPIALLPAISKIFSKVLGRPRKVSAAR